MTAPFPSRLLFTVTAPCPRLPNPAAGPEHWPAASRLPPLAELDGEAPFAAVRAAWEPEALHLAYTVSRSGPLTGNRQRPASGESVQVWLDLQPGDSPFSEALSVRHWVALPAVPGGHQPALWEQPVRGSRRTVAEAGSDAQADLRRGGQSYTLRLRLNWAALGALPPQSGREIGLEYLVTDTALGSQTWATPRELSDVLKSGRRPARGGRLVLTEG